MTSIDRVLEGGTIVVKVDQGAPRVLLIRTKDRSGWEFPKGQLEPGESLQEAAARETREEAGVVGRVSSFVGVDVYERKGRLKEVHYFRMDYTGDAPPDENRDPRWCTPSEARTLIPLPVLQRLLDSALDAGS